MHPPISISDLEEALEKEGARELLEAFLEDTENVLDTIQQSVIDRNSESLRAASHLLKGCLKVIGATKAASISSSMEEDATSSRWQAAEQRLPQLKMAYDDTRTFIKSYLNGG